VKTGHPSPRERRRATRTSSGLRAVSFVAVILALGLKVPLNRGEDHATMCAPHLPSPRVVRHSLPHCFAQITASTATLA